MSVEQCYNEKKKFLEICSQFDWDSFSSLGEVIGLFPQESFILFPETPKDGVIFASSMVDGIHYCMTPSMTDGHALDIYYVFPGMGDHSVLLIAHSMDELLSFAIGIYGAFECVFNLDTPQEFALMMEEVLDFHQGELEDEDVQKDLAVLKDHYHIKDYTPSEIFTIITSYQS